MGPIQELVLGPGNEILPQNQLLLGLVRNTAPLQVNQLLKLAQIYGAYPGTNPLGKHSALVALAAQAGPQVVQQVFIDYIDIDEVIEAATTGDKPGDEPGDKSAMAVSFQISISQVVVNGIGLLVETFVSIDQNKVETERYFVLGVAPKL